MKETEMGPLCGQWLNRGEFEEIMDGMRANIDRIERTYDGADVRMRVDCYRTLVDSVEWSLSELWRHGILCQNIPVYNFGKVAQGAEGPAGKGRGPAAGAAPGAEKGGGC